MKDRARDLRLGSRLALFMRGNNLVDASLARLVGAAVPTVATWRHGTRPSPHWRAILSKVTGWDWSDLESVAALSDEVALASKVTTPAQASFEGLVRARAQVVSGTLDTESLRLCAELLDAEIARRTVLDVTFRSAMEIHSIVVGSSNPSGMLALLRAHVDPVLITQVERSLSGATIASASA